LATTGWGVVEKQSGQITLRAYGVILSPAGTALPARLKSIRHDLLTLIQTHRPSVLAIEELFFTKFAVSIAATAQARGAILVTAADIDLPIAEYNPRAVKMATTGFGSANKIQMQEMIRRQLKLKVIPKPDDAADALALALCHLQTHHPLKVSTSRKSRAAFEADLAARAGVPL
jgi:crossover junction endodeoxyribonuclease RuvC